MTKKIKKSPKLQSAKFNPLVMAVFAAALAVAGYFIIFSKAAPAAALPVLMLQASLCLSLHHW
jgi:hypothetical protein